MTEDEAYLILAEMRAQPNPPTFAAAVIEAIATLQRRVTELETEKYESIERRLERLEEGTGAWKQRR